MTRAEATEVARRAAKERRWGWQEPVLARCRKRWFLFGPWEWHFVTNVGCKGGNVYLTIDDASGAVLAAGCAPR
jgi:hypothetical protein